MVSRLVHSATSYIDGKLGNWQPWKILVLGAVAAVALPRIFGFWRHTPWGHMTRISRRQWKQIATSKAYETAKATPVVSGMVKKEVDKELKKYRGEFEKDRDEMLEPDSRKILELPEEGLSAAEIVARVPKVAKSFDFDPKRVSGIFYAPHSAEHSMKMERSPETLDEFRKEFLAQFDFANPLHPEINPILTKFERDIVAWTGKIFGLDRPHGCVTSGGTESLMLAVKSAFVAAKERGVKRENMNIVMPISGHSAIHKAAEWLGVEVRHANCKEDGTVDMKDFKSLVDGNTIMLLDSFPNYAYGTHGPIKEIGVFAQSKGLPFHVDCCLGGFVAGWLKDDSDAALPPFDFSLPGVTSISADYHKYGFVGKGASGIIYRDHELYKKQFFTDPSWNGGANTTSTIQGSRSGRPIADTWITMQWYGRKRYTEIANNISWATREIAQRCGKELQELGIEVIGDPRINDVAFRAAEGKPEKSIWQVSTAMEQGINDKPINGRKWKLSTLQKPPAVHLCITACHAATREEAEGFVTEFVDDIKAAAEYVSVNPDAPIIGTAKSYGGVDDYPAAIVGDAVVEYVAANTRPYKLADDENQ